MQYSIFYSVKISTFNRSGSNEPKTKMIVEITKLPDTETHERFPLLMYLPFNHYLEGMATMAERVADADSKREAVTSDA